MLCESMWVNNKSESLPSPNMSTSLDMLWFLWVCCTMQKLKGKSNSVDIRTGHPVLAKRLQFWWFLQNGLPMWKLLWVEQSLAAGDMASKDTSGQCLQWALQASLQSSNSAAWGLVALSRSLWCCVSSLQNRAPWPRRMWRGRGQ